MHRVDLACRMNEGQKVGLTAQATSPASMSASLRPCKIARISSQVGCRVAGNFQNAANSADVGVQ